MERIMDLIISGVTHECSYKNKNQIFTVNPSQQHINMKSSHHDSVNRYFIAFFIISFDFVLKEIRCDDKNLFINH